MRYTDNYHFDLYEEGDNAIKAMDSRISTLEAACTDVESRIADLEAKVD